MIHCPKSVNGVAIRITQTDECGVPVDDLTNKQVLTSAFVSLTQTPNIEAGTEIVAKKADGSLCISRKQPDQLKWLDLSLQLCGIPYPVLSLLVGASGLLDGSDIVGGVLPSRASQSGAGIPPVQIDLWSINADSGACSGDAAAPYIHWVYPLTRNWQLSGDIVFGDEAANITLTGLAEETGGFEPAENDEWSNTDITAIQQGGPLAWKVVDSLPDGIDDCAFTVTGS